MDRNLLQAASAAALICASATVLTTPAAAHTNSIQCKTDEAQAQIPICNRRLGALAVRQPQNALENAK